MDIQLIENPDSSLIDFFQKRIDEFNVALWDIKEKVPLAIKVTDGGDIVAGAAGKTFGNWLLIDNLWVSEKLRGQDYGSKVLKAMEAAAKERGCKSVMLDTLEFQARGFYEKHGYKVQWIMEGYPRTGKKHFMIKEL